MTLPPAPSPKPRLLVVDDQPVNIQILFSIFSADYEVFMATSGEQALQVCAERQPDLVLLDVMMPGMDGHEVCRRLKSNPASQDIAVIFVTAQNDPAQESSGLELGAVDFISKPVNAAVVRARVGAHLLLRQALAQVRDLNSTLEARVQQRTLELETALQELHESQVHLAMSEAKATLSMLVASVAHELSSPIGNGLMASGTVVAQARDLQQLVDSGTLKRSDLSGFLTMLAGASDLTQQNLQRAHELIGNFRQVAADQASEQRRTFDLRATVSEIVHSLTPSLRRFTHTVVQIIPDGIVLNSQPGSLGQVVINLINNAYLHAFEGRTHGVVTLSATLQGERVVLVVEDNGLGIAPEVLAKMFQPFFSTKIGRGGTGLGMTIVHKLVTKTLGGEVRVQSTLGVGTRFEIELPLTLPPAT
ncbi:MAG: histidine kinase [Burkholderiales bacterium PBB3]|nr:MAG: histidine kinase [Burkholderiales bacterium PBB3]